MLRRLPGGLRLEGLETIENLNISLFFLTKSIKIEQGGTLAQEASWEVLAASQRLDT